MSNENFWNHLTVCQLFLLRIIIIIMSCRRHGYTWPSLTISPYRSSPLAGLQGCVPYPHIAAVCMFELVVLLLPGHMWGSIGVHHLWFRPCFSSSVLHVWLSCSKSFFTDNNGRCATTSDSKQIKKTRYNEIVEDVKSFWMIKTITIAMPSITFVIFAR